jgi:hypothetical protein
MGDSVLSTNRESQLATLAPTDIAEIRVAGGQQGSAKKLSKMKEEEVRVIINTKENIIKKK